MYVPARVLGTMVMAPASRSWNACEIVPRLYLGNLNDSLNEGALREHGVTHVLSALRHMPSLPFRHMVGPRCAILGCGSWRAHATVCLCRRAWCLQGVVNCSVPLLDVDSEDLLRHLPSTTAFISKALSGGGRGAGEVDGAAVLVHCVQGMSRSAAVVAAYLMASRGMSRKDAVELLVSKRPIVKPNPGFLRQLDEFGDSLRR